ncbi:MAG: ABC transporter permease [Patescibacteria group bacterium]
MTKFWENIKLALMAIRTNKGRAFLTMLGIIIGVFVIIILIGVGQSIKKEVSKQVEGLGSNLLVVLPGKMEKGSVPTGLVGESTLTIKDVDIIKNTAGVQFVSPLMFASAQVSYQGQIARGAIPLGTNPAIQYTVQGESTSGQTHGQMFADEDVVNKAKKAVIFTGLKNQFFPNEDPIGKKILLNKEEFEIVAYKETEASVTFGQESEFDNMVLIPYTVAESINNSNKVHRIAIKVAEAEQVKDVQEKIKTELLAAHDGIEEFTIFTQEEILSMFDQILSLMTNMLLTLAIISLIVGGIGIMNIMLVSVTERTKEIGLRKAVGASNSSILIQFLTEAVILGLFGGVIGVGLAKVGSLIVKYKFNFEPIINFYSVGVAIGFSLVIGIIFGVAPAIRASRLKPIDALRYE